MRKKLSLLAVALIAMLPTAWAYDFSATSPSGHTLYYEIISGTTNVGVVRPGTNSTYNNYVTGNVVIPDTVTYNGTTYNITELKVVSYYGTFENCSGLTSITIPNSVTSIGEYAFRGCSGLTSVTIPNSVTSIGNRAFYSCSSLTSINIPDSVTSIGEYAFYSCSSLTSVNIPDSVTSIGEYAFYNCSSLTSVNIPNSVTSIGRAAFYNVKHIFYNGTASGRPWGALSINGYVEDGFVYNDSTKTSVVRYIGTDTNVTIPNSVTSIGEYAFYNCSGLTSVTIPNSVTSIGYYAFYGCSGLTYITIPNSVTSIGNAAFYGCSNLDSVTIPNSVTTIGNFAFRNCTSLTSIIIPNSVTSIGNSTFADCSSLNLITIPNSVTSIGEYAFSGCSNLDSVTIPNSVTTIGRGAFYNCTSLTSIIIPNSVIYISHYAFQNCHSLGSVTIPNSVTYIGIQAFKGCSNLREVISLANTPPSSVGLYCFYNIPNDAILKVPCAKSHLYTSSSWNNYFSNIVEMCDGVDTVIYATICPGETYTENGFNVSVARGYLDTLQSANNSDSIILLRLSINPTYDTTIYDYIGPGETYTDNGFNVSQAGTYIDTLQTINGCDSIVRLILTLDELPACPGLKNPQNFISWYGKTGIRTTGTSTSTTIYNTASTSSTTIPWSSLASVVTTGNCGSGCNQGASPDNNKNRFQIITTAGNDAYTGGNVPRIPEGATSSIRLGDMCSASNESAEALFYEMTVTPDNALLFINYAVVLESPSHGPTGNPEFIIRVCRKVNDQWQNVPINDSLYYIMQAPNSNDEILPYGWYRANIGWSCPYVYKPWTKTGINLSQYLYSDIRIEIYISDCYAQFHGAYCYISGECMPSMQLTIDSCSSIVAHTGLESYQWFRKNSLGEWDTIQGANTYKYKPRETDFYTDSIGNRVDSNEFRCLAVSRMLNQALDSTYLSINVQRNQINFNLDTIIYDTICANEIYTENGFNVYGAGEHIRVVQSSNGCDSTITLLLTVNPVQTTQLYDTISLSETYNDNGFNTNIGGIHTDTLQAVTGCDSIVMLHLSIDSTYYTTIFDTICDNETYTENGFNTAFAGTYENTLQATIGCDSVITLHLTVNPTYTEMVYDTIYVEEGRDSSYYLIDSLQTIFGCDSVVVHNITIIVDPVSITENSDISDNLDLYPNPTTGIITFNRTDIKKVEVLDAVGRMVMAVENKHIIDLSKLNEGYYTLRITLPEGMAIRKVIRK